MRIRSLIAIVLLLPSVAAAQRGGGMGSMGRGRMPTKPTREPGIEVPKVINAINLMIENRPDLALSDSQFIRVLSIKRALDSTNAPLLRRVDSVARLFKSFPLFAQPTPERRDSLASARALVRETMADVDDNIAEAREKAFALLSASQLAKVEQIEEKARKAGASPGRGRL